MKRKGFTLFELLAVLTVISIGLVVLMGAYGSWGTAQALTGATRILEAGLQHARTLACTQRAFVGFDYGTLSTNDTQTVSGFQLYLCTNDNAIVASILQGLQDNSEITDSQYELMGVTKAAPYQRLSGHIKLGNISEQNSFTETGSLFFRPDGSVWSWGDKHSHDLYVYSRELFNKQTLTRILRVDLATGLVTVIGGAP